MAAGVWEIGLASVAVAPAAASIVDANITDERGPRATGTDIENLSAELLDPATGHRHEGTAGTGRKVRHADLASLTTDDHHAEGPHPQRRRLGLASPTRRRPARPRPTTTRRPRLARTPM